MRAIVLPYVLAKAAQMMARGIGMLIVYYDRSSSHSSHAPNRFELIFKINLQRAPANVRID